MHPYDKIVSRDDRSFPLDDFSTYSQLLLVDWKEEEPRILSAFFNATGLSSDGAKLYVDDKSQYYQLVRGDVRIDVPWGDEISAQHSMLVALQRVFGASHSIRYLNHAFGDTGYFVVETNESWRRLESQNPNVRWFFTPIELLPDVFKSDVDALAQVGRRYGET
jgi:hypothetical protein